MNECNDKIFLSTNLKHLRIKNKKSLNDIAKVCQKTNVAIHYWENGTREPNAVDIWKLSNYFNVSVNDLLLKDLRIEKAYPNKNSNDETEFITINDNLKIAIEKGTELTYEDIVTVQQKLADELKKNSDKN